MTTPKWASLVSNHDVVATTEALWVKVSDYIRGPRRLRIQAAGEWNYTEQKTCGPDGNAAEGLPEKGLLATAAVGCLIAKVGGSAGDTGAAGKIFAAGSYAIVEIAADAQGALFLGMNDVPQNFDGHSGYLTVDIDYAD